MNPTDIINLIRARAQAYGIDPSVAVGVAKSEGLDSYVGDKGSSFGPYQLHYGGVASGGNAVSGLGDEFTKQTGLDARDPNTVPQQIDFALKYASTHGWGPWHGWKGDQYAGINATNQAPETKPQVAAPSQVAAAPLQQPGAPSATTQPSSGGSSVGLPAYAWTPNAPPQQQAPQMQPMQIPAARIANQDPLQVARYQQLLAYINSLKSRYV